MMKLFKRFAVLLMIIALVVISFGCSSAHDGYRAADGVGGYAPSKIIDGAVGFDDEMLEVAPEGEYSAADDAETSVEEEVQRPVGLITASAWNDNQYYDYYLTLFDEEKTEIGQNGEETTTKGKFRSYYENARWGFDNTSRVKVTVKAGETPAAGAVVTYFLQDQSKMSAVADANGVCYIFPDTATGSVTVSSGSYSATAEFDAENRDLEVQLDGAVAKAAIIKLMFVVDVTGSMGDELNYLTAELDDVIKRVAAANGQIDIDLAFLFYRDNGDKVKFDYYDFMGVTRQENLTAQLNNLAKQRAEGGGDYPEALDEALEMAINKNWGNENSTKIIFHVFDAPPHEEKSNQACYQRAARGAAAKGIRINPVLCSGADLLCEYLARQTAILTGGHFVYVTDDSGIGNAHYDPNIPNAVVERLNDLIVRLVDGYYTGEFADPVDWKTATAGNN